MYKKKELIAMLEACRKYPQIETSQLEDKLRSAIKTKRRPRLNSKNKNALMDIYNAGVEDPAKKKFLISFVSMKHIRKSVSAVKMIFGKRSMKTAKS